jgi:hypothetical protein
MIVIKSGRNKKFFDFRKNGVLLQRKQADKFYSISHKAAHQF